MRVRVRERGFRVLRLETGVFTLVDGLIHAAGLTALLVPSASSSSSSAAAGHVFHGVLFDVVHCE